MSDVMQRCVPLSTGALGPDLRVNYQFGLVLGVDEFEQEDLYFRERDERHARSLHGYGTSSGLHVTAATPEVAPEDVEIRVAKGTGIDQHGRPIVIRSAQCGRIGAWIAEEERLAAEAGQPSPLDAHRIEKSGEVTIYVVASYGSCLDALVPLPGNPCGSDDEVTAASRIRDTWNLELRWDPPDMPAWDGVRALADLLLPVELDDRSPVVSHEDVLAAHIRALVPGSPTPAVPVPDPPLLPRSDGRAALDRLLSIWVTEVRPTLAPDLIQPDGEAGILLSSVTVVPAAPFDRAKPVITSFARPDDEGRPYLAPTQLIQELTFLGGGATTIVPGEPPAPTSRPQVELAVLGDGIEGGRHLVLVPDLGRPLLLPATVPVRRDGGAPVDFTTTPAADASRWILRPPGGAPLRDRQLLRVELDVADLAVRDDDQGTRVPLAEFLDGEGIDLLGRRGDVVSLHHQVPPEPGAPPPPRQVQSVLTVTPPSSVNELLLELWFHVDKHPMADDERIDELSDDAVMVFAENEGDRTPVPLSSHVSRTARHNVFTLEIKRQEWEESSGRSPLLRIVLLAKRIDLRLAGTNLWEHLAEVNATAPDVSEDDALITTYVRLPEEER